jgi:hypothetical protein
MMMEDRLDLCLYIMMNISFTASIHMVVINTSSHLDGDQDGLQWIALP